MAGGGGQNIGERHSGYNNYVTTMTSCFDTIIVS